MPKGDHLGEFEQVVLLAVARADENAHPTRVYDEIHDTTGRDVSLAAVYVTLVRLEKRRLVRARRIQSADGGRILKHYRLTPAGRDRLLEAADMFKKLWKGVRLLPRSS